MRKSNEATIEYRVFLQKFEQAQRLVNVKSNPMIRS